MITGPPIFLKHPTSHIVTVGMTVRLYCNVTVPGIKVSGIEVSYVWERKSNGGNWLRVRNTQSYKYDVRNIQQTKQYRCIAGNDAGSIASNASTIQVLSKS